MLKSKLIQTETNLSPYFRNLVDTAVQHHQFEVTDVSRFYIVNLLSSFVKTDNLFDWKCDHYEETPLAIMLATALNAEETAKKIKIWKKIGDVALYISGFFSDHIDSKLVDIDYYMSMGEGAYQNLSGLFVSEKTFYDLYSELSSKFSKFVDIITEVKNTGETITNGDLVRLYERWLKTGDPQLKERLEKEGIIPQKLVTVKSH